MRFIAIPIFAAFLLLSCSKNDNTDPVPPPDNPPVVAADTLGAWQFKTIDSLGRPLTDMVFTDANTGYVCGEKNAGFKTTDGGITWKPMTFPAVVTPFWFLNINFINNQYGFLISDIPNGVLRTTDGGSTWQHVPLSYRCRDVFFVNAAQGYVATDAGLLKSVDSGKTWAAIPSLTAPLSCLYFLNSTKGFFTSREGTATLYGTQNGGSGYTQLASGTTATYNQVWFANTINGCAGLGRRLYITNDGGTSWSLLKEFNMDIVDAKNTGSDNYYVSTDKEVWHTSNGGSTWIREMKLVGAKEVIEFSLTQSGRVWASGSDGRLYYK